MGRLGGGQHASINRRIFAALFTVGFLGLFARFGSIAKDLALARQYGINDQLDAFLVAYIIPVFAATVISGSFNLALVPVYIQVSEKESTEAAHRLFSSVAFWSLGLLATIALALGVLGPVLLPLVGPGFTPEKRELALSLYRIMLPMILCTGLATLWGAILNAREKFALAAIVPLITPLSVIASIFTMSRVWGIYALAYGTLAGSVLELGLLSFGLRKQKIPILPRWAHHPAFKQVLKLYAPMIAGAFMMSSTQLIDQSFASRAGSGGVSTLNYANKIIGLLTGIGAVALGTAVLPYFSRMVTDEDWAGIRRTLKLYSALILAITVPVMLLCAWQSETIIRLLFERGEFTARDTAMVASVQRFYLLQLPFYILGILHVRLISALKANYALMCCSGINLFNNILFDYLFLKWFGVPGIALSTSLVYLISTTLVVIWTMKLLRAAQRDGERAVQARV